MIGKKVIRNIQNLISKSKIEEALDLLSSSIKIESNLYKEVLILKSRFSSFKDKKTKGIISEEFSTIELNIITSNCIEITNKIEGIDLNLFDEMASLKEITELEQKRTEQIIDFKINNNIKKDKKNQEKIKHEYHLLIEKVIHQLKLFAISIESTIKYKIIKDNEIKYEIKIDFITIFLSLILNPPNSYLPEIFISIHDTEPPFKGWFSMKNVFQICFNIKLNKENSINLILHEKKSVNYETFAICLAEVFKEKYLQKIPYCRFCEIKIFSEIKELEYVKLPSEILFQSEKLDDKLNHYSTYSEICNNCSNYRKYNQYEQKIYDDWANIYDMSKENIFSIAKNKIFFNKEQESLYELKRFKRKYDIHFDTYLNAIYYSIFKETLTNQSYLYNIVPKYNNLSDYNHFEFSKNENFEINNRSKFGLYYKHRFVSSLRIKDEKINFNKNIIYIEVNNKYFKWFYFLSKEKEEIEELKVKLKKSS